MDAELFWRRRKHKKKRKKKKKKWYRRLFGKHKSNKFHNRDSSLNSENRESKSAQKHEEDTNFSDFNDIKFRIHPNQEEDIVKFINNLHSPPEVFNFDIDSFVAKRPVAQGLNNAETATEKAYFDFVLPVAPVLLGSEPIYQNLKNSQINNIAEFKNNKQFKRDILTQRLKSIANKISLFPPTFDVNLENQMLVEETTSKMDTLKENLEATNYNQYDNYAFSHSIDPQADEFVDKFYLLNDGEKYVDKPLKNEKSSKSISTKSSDSLDDLDIDLDLDRKFRNLNYSKNTLFYADIANNSSINDYK